MKQSEQHFDVVVVGGGHAGSEACLAAARMGQNTALITHRFDRIGEMSCNPAIGGLGKGHLVREIDALGGAMGRVADRAGIQFRLLNRRKGPAVQGPRVQCDRALYRAAMQSYVAEQPNLNVIEGEVADIDLANGAVSAVILADGRRIETSAVVLTTGTFLGGIIHIGDESRSGGRAGDPASHRLADRLREIGPPMGRLKTGTPPRLDGSTIDWSAVAMQPGDEDPTFMSFETEGAFAEQVSCGITHTNAATHEIIRKNLTRSAMYSGRIQGVGPRYCPSIEDKIARFPDKTSHQIFLEPEGLSDNVVYPNGISTSLPADVQIDYVRSITGLERTEILKPGYAIEYDYVDPRALGQDLCLLSVKGLYLAGQINGTTGYEEAGAQGLVAGLNAAKATRGEAPAVFDRRTSYIGVMIDDLTLQGVTEPYRMFTSRAEYRLSLRADNADQRLTPMGVEIGCVPEDQAARFEEKMGKLSKGRSALQSREVTPQEAKLMGLDIKHDGVRRSAETLLSYPEVEFEHLLRKWPELSEIEPNTREQLERDCRYLSYLQRQQQDVDSLSAADDQPLPADIDYQAMPGLSAEFAEKLNRIRPSSIGQAGRIEGATPAALVLLLAHAKRASHRRAS